MFDLTQDSTVRYYLLQTIKDIQTAFGIDWPSVEWSDLTKPLYSAIGARLYLQYQSRANTAGIPRPIEDQGKYWVQYYRPSSSASVYVSAAERLEQGKIT